jgi:hypothetical protein
MILRWLTHFPSSLAQRCAAFKNIALAPHVVFPISLRRPAGGNDLTKIRYIKWYTIWCEILSNILYVASEPKL